MATPIKILKPGPEPDNQAKFDIVDPARIFWMRPALAHESPGVTKLELSSGVLISRETIAGLKQKALTEGVAFVALQAPADPMMMEVNKAAVVNVEEPEPTRDPASAGSSLYFGGKRLAVRTSVAQTKLILGKP